MLRQSLTGLALLALSVLPAGTAGAQSEAEIREQVNRSTISIVTDGAGEAYGTGTDIVLAGDMAAMLDKENELRILPIMSYGPVQTVRDLLYLRGIDFAMVHSDVLAHLKRKKLYPSAQTRLRYIVNLYDEPFHIVARKEIREVKQLAGRKVVVGKPGSGGEMSAQTLFAVLGVKPELVHHDWTTGVEKVRSGDAAAMVYPAPTPSGFVQGIDGEGLHLLQLPASKTLFKTYRRAALTGEDYPNLVSAGQTVQTLAFGVLLAVYDWQPNTPRYARVAKVVERFLANLDAFRAPPRHPAWGRMEVAAAMPGWKRFKPVQDWLAKNPQKPTGDVALEREQFEAFQSFLRSQGRLRDVKDEGLKKLFQEFQEWQKRGPPRARSDAAQRAGSDRGAAPQGVVR